MNQQPKSYPFFSVGDIVITTKHTPYGPPGIIAKIDEVLTSDSGAYFAIRKSPKVHMKLYADEIVLCAATGPQHPPIPTSASISASSMSAQGSAALHIHPSGLASNIGPIEMETPQEPEGTIRLSHIKCECGAHSIGVDQHSIWCPRSQIV